MTRQASSTFVLRRPATRVADGDDIRVVLDDVDDSDLPLWTRSHLALLSVMAGVGLAVIAVSWYGSSGTRQPSQQVRWVAVSIVGLTVSAVANVAWVLRCRRVIGRALRTLPATLGWVGSSASQAAAPESEEIFVTAAPSTLYHRPDCVFAAGRTVRSASPAAHQRAGLSPCEVCEP
jgi:hypothetical protein